MGQTLNKIAVWTSAAKGADGKFESNPVNEKILNAVMEFTDGYAARNPSESKLMFKSPLRWHTSLSETDFEGDSFRKEGYNKIVYNDGGSDIEPVFLLLREEKGNVIAVRNFELIDVVLQRSGDGKLREVRACLEENRDPASKMLGDRFASVSGDDSSVYRFMEEVVNSTTNGNDQDKLRLKMLIQLRKLDCDLARMAIEQIGTKVRLNPDKVSVDIELMRQFAGEDETNMLRSIDYVEQFEMPHSNGYRAPIWRQIHGDICYLVVQLFDAEMFFVTASNGGYFVNNGWNEETEMLDFEKEGQEYVSLTDMFREKSPKFNENIDKLLAVLWENN